VEVNTLQEIVKFETPAPRGTVKLVDASNPDQLVELLHSEAKVF
jgi:electron transfer flavoprotein beta subunit